MELDWILRGLKKPDKTQAGIARALSLNPSQISRLLKGKRQLKAAEVPKIERYLGEEAPKELRQLSTLSEPLAAQIRLTEFGVNVAAGGGAIIETEEPIAHWELPARWLRPLTQAPERDLHVITVEGNSMEPDLYAGDKVIVDATRRSPTPPGIFVLNDGIGLIIKQLEHIPKTDPPRVEIKSVNKDYRADEATAEEINIVGRVIGIIRSI